MRRRAALALLGAAALAAGPGRASCLIFCAKEESVSPRAARDHLETELGQPLPEGVAPTHMLVGGFMDEFVQIRLTAHDDTARDALLGLLEVTPDMLDPVTDRHMTLAEATWWDIAARPDPLFAPARLGHYASTSVAVAPEGAGWLIYVTAFET